MIEIREYGVFIKKTAELLQKENDSQNNVDNWKAEAEFVIKIGQEFITVNKKALDTITDWTEIVNHYSTVWSGLWSQNVLPGTLENLGNVLEV